MLETDLAQQPQLAQNNRPLEQAYRLLEQKYTNLLTEFNSFRQTSIEQYEQIIAQLEKSRAHNDSFIKKLQKKYQSLLHEQRLKLTKSKQKLQAQLQKERQTYNEIISNKNNSIQKLAEILQFSEREKSEIVEENTQNLINIVKSEENCLQTKKYSHTELMKMYQYLLEENNCLKKQLLKVQITKNTQKSNEKTKRNKNKSPIVYTDQSDVGSSKLINVSNYLSSSFLKRQKTQSNENRQSFNRNTSIIPCNNPSKPASTYKPKTNINSKKMKANSSYQADVSSLIIEERIQHKKQPKKNAISSQNTKKTK